MIIQALDDAEAVSLLAQKCIETFNQCHAAAAANCCVQASMMIQTLDDAEALLFLDKNFSEMFNRMPADEVAAMCKRELSRLSQVSVITCC